ncbi:MAG: hypothetical protein ACJ8HI_12850 [Massilia sp.]
MRTLMLSFFSLFILLGCASPQDKAQKQQTDISQALELYGPACTQAGYVRDTDPWRSCVSQQASANNSGAKQGGWMASMRSRWSSWWGGDKSNGAGANPAGTNTTGSSTTGGTAAGK